MVNVMTTADNSWGRRRPTFNIADRLRKAREEAGLDQTELAARIAVSRPTVSNYETGFSPPRLIVLRAWAAVCGVEEEWLVADYVQPSRKRRGTSITSRVADKSTGQYLAWIPLVIHGAGLRTPNRGRLRAVA